MHESDWFVLGVLVGLALAAGLIALLSYSS